MAVERTFDQLTFGMETEVQEITIPNLKIMRQPYTKRTDNGKEWGCVVEYQKDLWHQEDFGIYMLHASQNVQVIQSLKLKAHDLLAIRGVPWTQKITLRGGKEKTINHINVTEIQVISRGQRARR